MSLAHLIKYALTLPPHVALARGGRYAGRILKARVDQVALKRKETYAEAPDGEVAALVADLDPGLLAPQAETLSRLAARTLEHRFDLLGSGPVRVEHGMACAGFGGHLFPPVPPSADGDLAARVSVGNRVRSQTIRGMIAETYRPIDWQIDFKSGYRWSEAEWHGTIAYGHEAGVDVKVPWELGRLQHLPQLALAFILAGEGTAGFEKAEAYRDEFRNQVLDFLAANPPGFGVNWACAMDVAIRAANLVLARGLFIHHGARFDAAFEAEFAAALLAHGRHVVANLEWHPEYRANHYLADIAGLLWVAAALPRTPETDAWLAFAVQEFYAEIPRQFTEDGANFEASTSYHRLSAEMAVWSAALILGLDGEKRAALAHYDRRAWRGRVKLAPAPLRDDGVEGVASRLLRMAEFSLHATKPNGRVVQVGDNDSGRFFKLLPVVDAALAEDDLDHRATVAALNGLFGRADLAAFAGPGYVAEGALVRGLVGGATLDGGAALTARGRSMDAEDCELPPCRTVIRLPNPGVLEGVEALAYPDFGLYLWRGPRLFLSVRCGPIGQNGNGGHAHNDQLAVELNVDGEDWLADPGTWVYTADPAARDAYRSALAHAVPQWGGEEPARLDLGLFRLEDRAQARCLRFDSDGFLGEHRGFGEAVSRAVVLDREAAVIVIADSGEGMGETEVSDPEVLGAKFGRPPAFSPGYGKRVASRDIDRGAG